jgi:hypothetical protein
VNNTVNNQSSRGLESGNLANVDLVGSHRFYEYSIAKTQQRVHAIARNAKP